MAFSIKRFWDKVNKTDKCWIWTGSLYNNGYGKLRINYKYYYAHRISYELKYGKIRNNLCVLHKCDNKKCINPDHLFLGTRVDNNKDRDKKNRTKKGEDHVSSKLTNDQVLKIRKWYKNIDITQKQLSYYFHVGQDEISRIINFKYWKHIGEI